MSGVALPVQNENEHSEGRQQEGDPVNVLFHKNQDLEFACDRQGVTGKLLPDGLVTACAAIKRIIRVALEDGAFRQRRAAVLGVTAGAGAIDGYAMHSARAGSRAFRIYNVNRRSTRHQHGEQDDFFHGLFLCYPRLWLTFRNERGFHL